MIRSLTGDCRTILPQLDAQSVHCVVTSPPYFGLRDYGTATWEGGDSACDHLEDKGQRQDTVKMYGKSSQDLAKLPFRGLCGKCGATRIDSQIGIEPTPQAYIDQMVAVFREVRRVLRDDGTLWLNLGDSYASSVNGRSAADTKELGKDDRTFRDKPFSTIGGIFKPKDILGMPWRVAFALHADGWYLRQDIIWSKPNPMPESVTDRCTKAHEYIFLLSKNARYYYDAEATAEPCNHPEGSWGRSKCYDGDDTGKLKSFYGNGAQWKGCLTRNKRSVWEIATQPFSEAHFATFPPALIEPCIMAGCPKGGTVLDPFGGAGTTGMVADRLGRNAVLIELNPQYATMASNRIKDDAGMFASIDTATVNQ